ncbi:MAG: hypothetical protein QG652_299 [Pseudomonadota bacterium]|nr:hypothetical protein [Pseudomonadota bacterium]
MTDNSSGQSADQWKKKFYDQIDQLEKKEGEWEKLETLLKRTIGRLSLAAEGHHRPLDQYIRDVRDSVRDKVNSQRLESVLDKLSAALVKIEEQKNTPPRQIVSVLQQLTESLALPESCRKAQEKLSKKITKADDSEYEALVKEWLALLKTALTSLSGAQTDMAPGKEKKPGLLNRLLGGAMDSAGTVQTVAGQANAPAAMNDLETYRGYLVSFLDKLDNNASPDGRLAALRVMARDAHERVELDNLSASLAAMLCEVRMADKTMPPGNDAEVRDDMQPSIQELLIRLLEQLVVPPDLIGEVEVMKSRLEKETAPADWQKLLKDVAILINSIRSRMQREKQEFEVFLQQITNRLKELDNYLQTESNSLQQAEQQSRGFDEKMNIEVDDIRQDVSQASDLEELKHSVQNRLDVISRHIKDYRGAEQTRIAEAQNSVITMQSRMTTLEREAQNLKTVLVEKNRQALSDALTGIPNRLAYEQRVHEEIGRWKRFGNPLSLAIWDVDYFKKVNDTYGHKAGDKVLKTIAQLLVQRIRNTDFMARFGGEEFVMLLPGTKEEETLRLVNELRKQVEECGFHYHGTAVKITVSCGVSSFHADDTLEQVFDRADKALYRAKKGGRNQCVIAAVRSD